MADQKIIPSTNQEEALLDVQSYEQEIAISNAPDRENEYEEKDNDNNKNQMHRRRSDRENAAVDTSSLDFERVVNLYTIQATRDRIFGALQEEHPNGTKTLEYDDDALLLPQTATSGYSTFQPESEPTILTTTSLPPPPPPPPPRTRGSDQKGKKQGVFLYEPKPHALGYTGRTATRWCFTVTIGLLTGIISIFIVRCTDSIQEWRFDTVDALWRNDSRSILIFALYTLINLTMALLSAALCLYLAPQAVGSGIPEVKAYLNGVRVLRFSNSCLFLVKIVGTILSVSSGLAIGPEGPLVHIGAILGASCTKLSSTLSRVLPVSCYANNHLVSAAMTDLSHFAHDSERRDFVSIGAAAGFAAAFGTPIGGLLFALEEAASYFDQTMFLKTLAATAIATFCLAVHHGNLSDYSVISLGQFHTSNANIFVNRVEELPLYILVAVVGGLMGGMFVKCWKSLKMMKKRHPFQSQQARNRWELCEVALVSLLTSTVCYCIPLMEWTCRNAIVDDVSTEKEAPWRIHPRQFDCKNGNVNELATIFFGSRENAISEFLTDPSQFTPTTLCCVGLVFFILMTLTAGVSLPSGIFMPTFLIGSSLGGAAGIMFQRMLGGHGEEMSPSTFALLGAAALLSGIQRSTVSLCVILVEGTGQVKVLMPVIITVVVARYVGDKVTNYGLYETAMEVAQYPYLEHAEKKLLDLVQVRDIMSSPPVTIGPREKAYNIQRVLRDSEHHGFPVVSALL